LGGRSLKITNLASLESLHIRSRLPLTLAISLDFFQFFSHGFFDLPGLFSPGSTLSRKLGFGFSLTLLTELHSSGFQAFSFGLSGLKSSSLDDGFDIWDFTSLGRLGSLCHLGSLD
jgi:hypothetical protein